MTAADIALVAFLAGFFGCLFVIVAACWLLERRHPELREVRRG